MSLLTTEVEITLNSKNYKHYEALGYIIPKHLDKNNKWRITSQEKILVKVEDLQYGSAVLVRVKCDDCGKEYITHYSAFYKCNHNGQSFCLQCAKAKERNNQKTHKDKRRTYEYRMFLRNVLKRDNYTCQCCGSNDNLEVHHLDAYNWCIEKRTDIDNGVTLCNYCHIIFHKKYGKGEVTKEQYDNWINNINFDELLKDKNEIIQSNKKHGQIYCVTTGEIFYSFREAAGVYDIKQMDNIRLCCLGKSKSCGKNKNGEKLIWMYYKDYINLNNSFTVA